MNGVEQQSRTNETIVVIGAGLVGCLIAIYLARLGCRVTIYEKKGDPRSGEDVGRRPSINLTLCARGLEALKHAGVKDQITNLLTPVYGRMNHLENGSVVDQLYSDCKSAIYSIRRTELNIALIAAAEKRDISIEFNNKCVGCDARSGTVVIANAAGSTNTISASCIIAADGALSAVRSFLQKSGHLKTSIQYSQNGYKSLTIPSKRNSLKSGRIHLWPRRDCMAIAFPNRDGSYGVAVHRPLSDAKSLELSATEQRVENFLADYFADLVPYLETPGLKLLSQRPNTMATVKCEPWSAHGRILLIGDAAHGCLPHFGQGANAGFEDCKMIADLAGKSGTTWAEIIGTFENNRRPDTDMLGELCFEHARQLHYWADNESSGVYQKLERYFHRLCPTRIIPLYTMMSFSLLSYTAVKKRHEIQKQLISQLIPNAHICAQLKNTSFEHAIREQIEKTLPLLHA